MPSAVMMLDFRRDRTLVEWEAVRDSDDSGASFYVIKYWFLVYWPDLSDSFFTAADREQIELQILEICHDSESDYGPEDW